MKQCTVCHQTKSLDDFHRNKNNSDGRAYRCKECTKLYFKKNAKHIAGVRKKYKDGIKDKISDYNKQYYEDHSESLKDYQQQRREEQPEKVRESLKRWRDKNVDHVKDYNQKWKEENKDYVSEYNRWYQQEFPEVHAANHAKRRATKLEATPNWANLTEIQKFYDEAKLRTKKTGVQHHVDHIVPLQHDLVCGLHNEYNLQILTYEQNCKKKNSFSPGPLWWILPKS